MIQQKAVTAIAVQSLQDPRPSVNSFASVETGKNQTRS
jgi:hypothetical protein